MTQHHVTVPKPEKPLVATAPKTARFALPAGVVTPIELRNFLVAEAYADESLKPQQMYAYVKSPGKDNPFPVKFYEEDGTVHDKQPGGKLTRPGIPSMQEGVEWYVNRATKPSKESVASDSTEGSESVEPEDESEAEAEFEEAE